MIGIAILAMLAFLMLMLTIWSPGRQRRMQNEHLNRQASEQLTLARRRLSGGHRGAIDDLRWWDEQLDRVGIEYDCLRGGTGGYRIGHWQ